jgi:transcriptional regulator with XRE-family HTH domain
MRKSTITAGLARRVKELRDAQAMSQEALASAAGINRVTLARLELGLHEPTLETLERLARALEVSLHVELIPGKTRRRR